MKKSIFDCGIYMTILLSTTMSCDESTKYSGAKSDKADVNSLSVKEIDIQNNEEERSRFRSKIEIVEEEIITSVKIGKTDGPLKSNYEIVTKLMDNINTINGESWSENLLSENEWRAKSHNLDAEIIFDKMLYVLRDKRGYDVLSEDVLKKPVLDNLISRSITVLDGVIDNIGEIDNIQARVLKAVSKRKGYLSEPEKDIAYKVFINRRIGGVRVLTDRLVFSYALDGTFRKMLGTWTRVDITASLLEVSLEREEIIERGIDKLIEEGVLSDEVASAILTTVLVPVKMVNGYHKMVLTGLLTVTPVEGEDMMGGMVQGYEFDLTS